MKPKVVMIVLSGLLVCMFSVARSQNSSTSNSNTNRNANAVNRRGGNPYAGIPCAPNATSNVGCDPNAGWNEANMAANAANAPWFTHYANSARNSANVASNANANVPRKTPTRKKRTRRPIASLGGAFTFGNSVSAMLAAGVS